MISVTPSRTDTENTLPSALARATTLVATAALLLTPGALTLPASSVPAEDPTPSFTRIDVDKAVAGASFTVVGELFPGEQNIITSGYGRLEGGSPVGGGTLQVYRPGDNLWSWSRVSVFGPAEGIVFPNRTTVADVNEDGLNDIVVPSGWFFEPDGPPTRARGALTWWENKGLDTRGNPRPFVRHDIVEDQQASFHGIELVDLDGDGVRDIVTTSEAGRFAHLQDDDTVTLQYLRGRDDHTFDAPRTLATGAGGSVPVVRDVDGDGRLDIVSSQYFGIANTEFTKASFLWFERVGDTVGPLSETDFTKHTIATMGQAGHGFAILPVPDLREPGTLSWVGVNHQNRCFMEVIGRQGQFPAEAVMEFTPGDDIREPWDITVLSVPETPSTDPLDCDDSFRDGTGTIHPGNEITSRPSPGQAGPGVFGHGDVDGDGDTDLLVSGDGDRRLFWIERVDATTTRLHTLTGHGEEFGQSGGAVVTDLNRDGTNELLFSSFDTDTVAMWTLRPGTKPAPPAPPAPPIKKVASRTSVKATYAKKAKVVTIRTKVSPKKGVKSNGKARGKVRIVVKRGKKTVRERTLRLSSKSSAALKIKKLRRKGRYTVRVTYTGSTKYRSSKARTSFRIR